MRRHLDIAFRHVQSKLRRLRQAPLPLLQVGPAPTAAALEEESRVVLRAGRTRLRCGELRAAEWQRAGPGARGGELQRLTAAGGIAGWCGAAPAEASLVSQGERGGTGVLGGSMRGKHRRRA